MCFCACSSWKGEGFCNHFSSKIIKFLFLHFLNVYVFFSLVFFTSSSCPYFLLFPIGIRDVAGSFTGLLWRVLYHTTVHVLQLQLLIKRREKYELARSEPLCCDTVWKHTPVATFWVLCSLTQLSPLTSDSSPTWPTINDSFFGKSAFEILMACIFCFSVWEKILIEVLHFLWEETLVIDQHLSLIYEAVWLRDSPQHPVLVNRCAVLWRKVL